MFGEAYKTMRKQAAASLKEAILPREPDHPILATLFYVAGCGCVYALCVLHLIWVMLGMWARAVLIMFSTPFFILYVTVDIFVMTMWVVVRSVRNQVK